MQKDHINTRSFESPTLLFLLVLAACSASQTQSPSTAASIPRPTEKAPAATAANLDTSALPPDCDAPAGYEGLKSSLVLVGETHGTREIPKAFGGLVCQAAKASPGATVIVALELAETLQPALDRFLASDGQHAARAQLLAESFFRRPFQDGRSSEAMLDLIDALRRYRAAGLALQVVAIDVLHDSMDPNARDAAMARALERAIQTYAPKQTWVLAGNVHTRAVKGYPWDPTADYTSLATHMRARFADTTALDYRTLGGSMWACVSADPKDCGIQKHGAQEGKGTSPHVELDPDALLKTGYSGVLFVGEVSASRPATQQAQLSSP